MNFDDMSDLDINRKLTQIVKGYSDSFMRRNSGVYLDYCNSWADMGTLIHEYGVSIHYSESAALKWHASSSCGDYGAYEWSNPLRAAAICLIKKLEAEND